MEMKAWKVSQTDLIGDINDNGQICDNYNDDDDAGGQFSECEMCDLDENTKESSLSHSVNSESILEKHKCFLSGISPSGRKIQLIKFSVDALLRKQLSLAMIDLVEPFNLNYKCARSDSKLVRSILNAHGLREVPANATHAAYHLWWTGSHVKPYNLRGMLEHQRVNHFPRSFELTRKDRLYKNIQRMQLLRGMRHFDIVPPSFLIPSEFQELCYHAAKDKGPFIVKPVALSRGRGIFLCNHPNQIPLDEQLIVSKYIHNPYLIDGLKFDMRIYVLVTSFEPLVAYVYEEGLTRFATVKYESSIKNLRSQCMHLTNYSVNKKNRGFIHNDDANVENHGNKWSLGALLRYLRTKGVDTTCLMMKVEDIIIKSLIAAEPSISMSTRMFEAHRGNCFELYGYDIIIDDHLRPWLLEVNLSPSLSCDSPLDFKIKSHMICDMFTLIGITCNERGTAPPYSTTANQRNQSPNKRQVQSAGYRSNVNGSSNNNSRRPSAGLKRREVTPTNQNSRGIPTSQRLEENRIYRRIREEHSRRGGWIRIFPAPESIETYGAFLSNMHKDGASTLSTVPSDSIYSQNLTASMSSGSHAATIGPQLNRIIHCRLYPDKYGTQHTHISLNRQSLHNLKQSQHPAANAIWTTDSRNNQNCPMIQSSALSQNYADTKQRLTYYERKLGEQSSSSPISDHISPCVATTDPHLSKMDLPSHTVTSNGLTPNGSSPSLTRSRSSRSRSSSSLTSSTGSSQSGSRDSSSENKIEISPLQQDAQQQYTQAVKRIESNGHLLTQIQARHAFSHYLSRVQTRLIMQADSSCNTNNESNNTVVTNQEQLDLVLRFLRRASVNIPASDHFVIPPVIPNRLTASLDKQQHYLAGLLGNFINIYCRETSLAEKQQLQQGDHNQHTAVSNKGLFQFLRNATEAQLERLLSDYTKVNKSAGIFLNPQQPSNKPASYSTNNTPIIFKSSSLTNLNSTSKSNHSPQLANPPCFNLSSTTANPSTSTTQGSNLSRPHSGSFILRRPGSTKLGCSSNQISYTPSTTGTINNKINTREQPADTLSRTLQKLAQDHRNRQLAASLSCLKEYNAVNNSNTPQHSSSQSNPAAASNSLSQDLLRQYSQSKQLLLESRAKHNALLMKQEHNTPNSRPPSTTITTTTTTAYNSNKPPPGIRTITKFNGSTNLNFQPQNFTR